MLNKKNEIAIVGGGVIGLSVALELNNRGYSTTIYAKEISPNTTSDVATAVWCPYKIMPMHKALPWAKISLEKYQYLHKHNASAGILFVTHSELFSQPQEKPDWLNFLKPLTLPDYIKEPYKQHSFAVKIPLIDTSLYMPYLTNLYLNSGGQIKHEKILDFKTLMPLHNVIINCSGLGAHELCQDKSLYPIRGQVISTEKLPQFDDSFMQCEEGITHLFSRSADCILGGITQENNWDLTPDPEVTKDIIERVKTIYPHSEFKILKEKVGLRPGRFEVRLEKEMLNDEQILIHNYGHGGAGYTVSWGCAYEVCDLVDEFYKK